MPDSTEVATGLARGTVAEVADALAKLVVARLGPWPTLALVFASTAQPLGELMPALKRRLPGTLLLGSSSAGEFTETEVGKGSASIFAVRGDLRVAAAIGRDLHAHPERTVEQLVAALPAHIEGYPHRTAILMLDPLGGRGEEVALMIGAKLGATVPVVGGAAGDDLRMLETQVGCDGDVATDAAVLAVIHTREPLGVGVHHGHRALSDPMMVTRAVGNVVHELDGRPAWDVWVEHATPAALAAGIDPLKLGPADLGGFLLRFEAGISMGTSTTKALKIRAPLAKTSDGALRFASGIAEGTVIRLTESDAIRQIESAREAARRAKARAGNVPVAGAVVFDCICRNLILGDRFGVAIRGISEELGGAPLAGFETYGEIALDSSDLAGFHNTTTVVLTFPV